MKRKYFLFYNLIVQYYNEIFKKDNDRHKKEMDTYLLTKKQKMNGSNTPKDENGDSSYEYTPDNSMKEQNLLIAISKYLLSMVLTFYTVIIILYFTTYT